MTRSRWLFVATALLGFAATVPATTLADAPDPVHAYLSVADIVRSAPDADWRTPDPENLLYMDLPSGRVVIELAPAIAPAHVRNVQTLVRQHYFDGLAIVRAQDNYVVQWADPDESHPRSTGAAKAALKAEFERPAAGLPFDLLPDTDSYAPQAGFVGGFPAALDRQSGRTWLLHCYGMVGAGRDNDADSGAGTELYAVIGQAPRHLDRNVTLLGRVLQGMEWLSTLKRGTGDMGFYRTPAEQTPIRSIRLGSDLPPAERGSLQVMRTDSESFRRVVEARRNRRDPWTKVPAGHIDVCNVPLPVR